MGRWALLKGGVIDNIIVVADDPAGPHEEFDPHAYVADDSNEYDAAADLTDLEEQPDIGWVSTSAGYAPPVVLATDKETVTGDGQDTATVTVTDNRPDPGDEVAVDVNGLEVTVPLAKSKGSLAVTSSTPGDFVTVRVANVALTIGVE